MRRAAREVSTYVNDERSNSKSKQTGNCDYLITEKEGPMAALVPVVGQSWPIKDVVSLLSRKQVAGKTGRGKSEAILRSNSAWRGKGKRKPSSKRWSGGIYEAQPAAEPRESVIFKTMNSLPGGVFGVVEYSVW